MASQWMFGLLGPVQAWRDDTELDLGTPQQRALMALLLLSEGKPVSLDGILNVLWGDDIPRSAGSIVRTYVHRLRRIIQEIAVDGSVVRPRIISSGGGYGLEIDASLVDLFHFQRGVAEARKARIRGDLTRASGELRTALRLWRGAALAGAAGQFFEAQRSWLEQLRMAALEELWDLEIESGNHSEAVPALTAITAEDPYREQLWALLMLALYRSGRQADALATYRHIARLLDRELGIEPGPALREMHSRILSADSALIHELRSERPAATIIEAKPTQLPPAPTTFVGRAAEIASVEDYLLASPGPSVVELTGQVGVGKTALALYLASSVAKHFPDGQLYSCLHAESGEPIPTRDILVEFMRALGFEQHRLTGSTCEIAALWRTALSNRRVLVVLNDISDSDQVFPLLPSSVGSAVIVTSSRYLVFAPGVHSIKLEPLTLPDATELFRSAVGAARVAECPAAAARIVEMCSRLPLAIRIAAGWIANRPSRSLEQMAPLLLAVFHKPAFVNADCKKAERRYVRAIQRLGPEFASACRLLALPNDTRLDPVTVAVLLDQSVDQASRTLEALVEANFIEADVDGSYYHGEFLKALLSRHAMQEEGIARCEAVLTRLAKSHMDAVKDAEASLDAGMSAIMGDSATQEWLRKKYESIKAIVEQIGDMRIEENVLAEPPWEWLSEFDGRLDVTAWNRSASA